MPHEWFWTWNQNDLILYEVQHAEANLLTSRGTLISSLPLPSPSSVLDKFFTEKKQKNYSKLPKRLYLRLDTSLYIKFYLSQHLNLQVKKNKVLTVVNAHVWEPHWLRDSVTNCQKCLSCYLQLKILVQ